MRLVKGLKRYWRSFTITVSVLGIAVTNIVACLPDWSSVPPDIKALIPPEHVPYVSTFFFVLAIIVRSIHQPSLHKNDKPEIDVDELKEQIKKELSNKEE